jgi:hypothetical protein
MLLAKAFSKYRLFTIFLPACFIASFTKFTSSPFFIMYITIAFGTIWSFAAFNLAGFLHIFHLTGFLVARFLDYVILSIISAK